MVLLLLEIKAELENITNLVPKGGSDGTEYTYYFKVIYSDFENAILSVLEVQSLCPTGDDCFHFMIW